MGHNAVLGMLKQVGLEDGVVSNLVGSVIAEDLHLIAPVDHLDD